MRASWIIRLFGIVCVPLLFGELVLVTMGMGLRRGIRVKAMASFMHGWCILSMYSRRI